MHAPSATPPPPPATDRRAAGTGAAERGAASAEPRPPAEIHLALVRALAGELARHRGPRVDRDELLSAGYAGLVEAAHRYRSATGAAFTTYAYARVAGAMRDQLRAEARACRARVPALDEPVVDADSIETSTPRADAVVAARETLASLRRALAELPTRERIVVLRCYLEGQDLAAAAAELGISISRASRIRTRALTMLRARVGRSEGT